MFLSSAITSRYIAIHRANTLCIALYSSVSECMVLYRNVSQCIAVWSCLHQQSTPSLPLPEVSQPHFITTSSHRLHCKCTVNCPLTVNSIYIYSAQLHTECTNCLISHPVHTAPIKCMLMIGQRIVHYCGFVEWSDCFLST